jgi:hypothetical protein
MVRSTICYVSLVNTEYWCYATVRIIEISNTEVGIIRYYLRYLFVCTVAGTPHTYVREVEFSSNLTNLTNFKFPNFQISISGFSDFDDLAFIRESHKIKCKTS